MKRFILTTLLLLLPLCALAEDTEKLTLEKTVLELQIQNMELQLENATLHARDQYEAKMKRIEEIKALLAEKKEEK